MNGSHIYLNFAGNTQQAFDFYKSVFGGEYTNVMRYGEMPAQEPTEECPPMPDHMKQLIMHIALPLPAGMTLMGADTAEGFGPPLQMGNNFSIFLDASTREEVDALFAALSTDGRVDMPPMDAFWGAYFTMFADKFGVQWMIGFEKPATA